MENIKGQCEHCGFAFKGLVAMEDGVFPELKCPSCGKDTQNFDYEKAVDEMNAEEALADFPREAPVYKDVVFN